MSKILLNAESRSILGKQVRQLRRQQKVPAVIYGHKIDSKPITLDLREATKILATVSSSSLVTLVLDGVEIPTLVRDKQIDFILGTIRHVDFQAVSMTEKIRASVSLHFEGESNAVKNQDAILTFGIQFVEIEAFPKDLPDRFVIDISKLENIGDAIHVKDLSVPEDVEVLTDQDELIVLASLSRPMEEEIEVEGIEEGEEDEEQEGHQEE